MREITFDQISEAVSEMCVSAACTLPPDVEAALTAARDKERSPLGRYALDMACENVLVARSERMPLCQDTGIAVVFVDVGCDVHVSGGTLSDAVNDGIRKGYEAGCLRKSIVSDPLFDRVNTQDNTPGIVHVSYVEGETLALTLLPKGGGSENMSFLAMLKPADGVEGVCDFVVRCVTEAGGSPCPPTIVGVGIGGNAESALMLSKRALARDVGESSSDERYALLEKAILDRVNATGIGPQGFGGTVTALAVHIEHYPTHMATLPVGVTLNCHVARHCKVVL